MQIERRTASFPPPPSPTLDRFALARISAPTRLDRDRLSFSFRLSPRALFHSLLRGDKRWRITLPHIPPRYEFRIGEQAARGTRGRDLHLARLLAARGAIFSAAMKNRSNLRWVPSLPDRHLPGELRHSAAATSRSRYATGKSRTTASPRLHAGGIPDPRSFGKYSKYTSLSTSCGMHDDVLRPYSGRAASVRCAPSVPSSVLLIRKQYYSFFFI